MKNNPKLFNKIKKYIKEHKEMQQDLIYATDLQKCACECGCYVWQVMGVIRHNKLLY